MVLVTPEKIASVMALFPVPHSFAELDDLVAHGLPKDALKASVDRVCVSGEDRKKLLYRIIPEATYKRRRSNLTADESERAERHAQQDEDQRGRDVPAPDQTRDQRVAEDQRAQDECGPAVHGAGATRRWWGRRCWRPGCR